MAGVSAEQIRAAGHDDGTSQPPRRRAPRSAGERGDATSRPFDGSRRRRSPEQRPSGWGDGVERYACARDGSTLPPAFPVESRSGAATIPATVVDRRPGALLLCRFTHGGPHRWPDGEETGEGGEA